MTVGLDIWRDGSPWPCLGQVNNRSEFKVAGENVSFFWLKVEQTISCNMADKSRHEVETVNK